MLRVISCGVIFLAISAGSGNVARAQWGLPCFDCCTTCAAPAPQPVTQAYVQPVVSTQYRQQQQISYQDVAQTEYRQESFYQSVPVTTYENVTVDEGSYQQVWVPKLTTKTVAKQGYQTQLSQRTVPYQVTRRIPRVTTQLVPEQRISYQTSYTTSYIPPVYTTYNTALLPPLTTPIVTAPISTPLATNPIPRRSYESSSLAPVPDPEFDESGRSTNVSRSTSIPRRAASNDRYDGYRSSTTTASKKFVPAPSAATVWQTPRGRSYR
ncbi:hypothetical protein [Symmachiella dynata]|uniref:hypothetical protein n=1 Tax=Symmachiella dynata TaxID=2527995 RepID=UPI0030EDF011